MLRLNKYAAQKIIDAYNTKTDREGLDFQCALYTACGVVEDSMNLADELGCEPDIILSDSLVEELSRINIGQYL
ncbi:hypothetical protein [Edwardsiella phage PEi26]|uniref:Uncharacterized protein n=1 Tax=Edwardsiella phage PEi26 TaxID=1608311 RepID=A0A0B6VLE4_9CAUD|nr:hypothetical protein [Edwardsiella phage PEi26]